MAKEKEKSSVRCHVCNKAKSAEDMVTLVVCKECAAKK